MLEPPSSSDFGGQPVAYVLYILVDLIANRLGLRYNEPRERFISAVWGNLEIVFDVSLFTLPKQQPHTGV